MKTSFYFVLWILIYPILGLFHNEFIVNNSFFVALAAVYGLSWLLNKAMPHTLLYEHVSHIAPILEEVYTGNVRAFSKRLSRDAIVESIGALYFCITMFALGIASLKSGVNDWFALLVFGFFMIGSIRSSAKLVNAWLKLKSNPTPEQCLEIVEDTYKMDYTSYYEAHEGASYEEMLPLRPRHFKAFQVFSIVTAVVATLLGLLYILSGVSLIFVGSTVEIGAMAGMYFLYGSLATYFGVKDIITIANAMKTTPAPMMEQHVE